MEILLGLDDTDVLGHKPGTGRLARDLAAHLADTFPVRAAGVVRHQLLVDPRIPYTSHNSPACIVLETPNGASDVNEEIFAAAARYLISRAARGSDPGLCLAEAVRVAPDVVAFGYRAASEVVQKGAALALAAAGPLRLEELGGSGDGVIGALAAVGLTAGGNSGRFLDLGGRLRSLGERVPAATLASLGMTVVSASRNADPVPHEAVIHTGDWLRPRLVGGRPVLFVERDEEGWRCFDRKKPHSGGEDEC